MTALTDAIRNGDVAAVERELAADPSSVSELEGNVSPLLFALYHGRREIAELLVDRGAPLSFAEACAMGESDRAESMLAGDRTVLESRSPDGYPPLALAVFFGHPSLARRLIELGADVDAAAENAQKVAPLHAAAARCDRETMKLLLERGADPNGRQQMDYTPLHGAASRGDIEMAKLLLAHGALRDVRASDGMTPADVARKYGREEFALWIEVAHETGSPG